LGTVSIDHRRERSSVLHISQVRLPSTSLLLILSHASIGMKQPPPVRSLGLDVPQHLVVTPSCIAIHRLFSDTLPAISQSDPISCDAPPIATCPTCRAYDRDILSPTPSATGRSSEFVGPISHQGGVCDRNRPQLHTRPLTYSVLCPSSGVRGPLFCFTRP
jgi:hypothetical protein